LAAGFYGGSHILKPIKWYVALHTSKGRASANAFLVEGYRAIRQIVHNVPDRVIEILYLEGMEELDKANCSHRFLSHSQFHAIALSRNPSGPLAVVTLPAAWEVSELPDTMGTKVLVLEDIQDPGNIGSLIRSAVAFDFSGIILSQKCADPFAPKSTQASCGAIVSPWLRRPQNFRGLLGKLKAGGFKILAADTGGSALTMQDASFEKVAIVFGNEGNGLSEETMRLADKIVKIPFNDEKVESLNVAASGAICMFMSTGHITP
jgi:RNA methyltransferase, TrmH family